MPHESPMSSRLERVGDNRWKILSPAKLNLGLRIFPPRPDGFHDLESWMVSISWHDTLFVETGPTGESQITLEITGRSEGVPVDSQKNLAGRAALALARAADVTTHAHIILHKVLPPGGGIGGGSGNATSTLLALNEAWGLHWPVEKLAPIAAALGSDIAFFLAAEPALCTGRGEIMTPLPARHPLFAVLLVSPRGCPTKDVYQAFDALLATGSGLPKEKTDWKKLAAANADELNGLLVNDLQSAAFVVAPWLKDLQARASDSLKRPVHLTGSGSTLFTLCGSSVEASQICDHLTATLGDACVCMPIAIQHG